MAVDENDRLEKPKKFSEGRDRILEFLVLGNSNI